MHELWPAPFRGRKPISSQVTIPGSKSVTNRALILAAQATSPSIIRKPLISRDSELMSAGLVSLGVGIHDQGENQSWRITPAPLKGPALIDVGNAGTVMRFLPPLAALAQGEISFDGDSRSYERPIGPVIKALEELGIEIDHQGRYYLPMVIKGTGVIPGGKLTIDASKSSQFLSALLLVGPSTKKGITVTHNGSALPSMPHIDMTVQMLRDFGAEVDVDKASQSWSVKAGALNGKDLVIEPDLSNAAPFLSIAMVCGGSITIADWPKETTQPGDHLREIFTKMGARVELDASGLTLTGGDSIHGIDIDLHDVGELTPSIAALAALADSPSRLRGIGHLRLHETDRLAALTREINALGGSVVEEETALHITPAPLRGGTFHTYDDHRLATAGAVIGLVTPDVMIENVATTRKTLPDFPGLWKSLVL
ncbi:3-phosphoshikimate 1-carboxyvinyltransferase [Candidatus Planktophila versatilis]|uniref:3-phosphoshikimate 1-carboxyvinyltransferase n=1 Tax=Candidatus Planktophila versatilis TaxID=1884905 RepID=UPI000BACD7CE|nr:3-phosphoshikimate 1-carboxyvinyltransferase [Candidatus Planktophila versatilis]ASY25987.1 3-phosphoshikimate 1-carboxyvinyltransferase [Candidatus Planktophila versatilis]